MLLAEAPEHALGRTAGDMGHLTFPLVTMTIYGAAVAESEV